MNGRTSAALVLPLAWCLAGCGDDGSGPSGDTADIQATANSTFAPAEKTVAVGATVKWGFGALGHNVTFDVVAGRPADIPGTNTNKVVARTFATAGDFGYECTLHPGMRGTVHVTAPGVGQNPPPPPPPPPPGGGYSRWDGGAGAVR